MRTLLSTHNVWLNELFYDNTSTDEGEFIEIVLEGESSYTLSGFLWLEPAMESPGTFNSGQIIDQSVGVILSSFIANYDNENFQINCIT